MRRDGWWLMSSIIWDKPDANPESAHDRVADKHERLFMFTKQGSGYFFDDAAIADPSICVNDKRFGKGRVLKTDPRAATRGYVQIDETKRKGSVWRVALS